MRLAEEDSMGRTYVGRRNGLAGTVDVYGPDGVEPLDDRWNDAGPPFAWGQDEDGSVALARALLSDVFGVAATEDLAADFAATWYRNSRPPGSQSARRKCADGAPRRRGGS
jgi:hypothetical protein